MITIDNPGWFAVFLLSVYGLGILTYWVILNWKNAKVSDKKEPYLELSENAFNKEKEEKEAQLNAKAQELIKPVEDMVGL